MESGPPSSETSGEKPVNKRRLNHQLRSQVSAAARDNSIPQLQSAINTIRSEFPEDYAGVLHPALRTAVRHNSLSAIRYILEHEDADVSSLSNMEISFNLQIPLLEIFLANGRDINQQDYNCDDTAKGRRLIDWSCHDDEVVRWLVEHGARVDGGEEEFDGYEPRPRPLLETCAAVGSLETFKFLQSRGAKLGSRTLHRAAEKAASVGADPANMTDGIDAEERAEGDIQEEQERRNAEMILRYLVDGMGIDVNAMDTNVMRGYLHFGTPINYAARQKKGAKVVKWLLAKGADPSIKSLDEVTSNRDAEAYARGCGCAEILELLMRRKG